MARGTDPNSLANLRPALPGEVRNPHGARSKVRRDTTFKAVLMAADKLAGKSWSDPDYLPGASAQMALVRWIEADEKNEREFWTKIFSKTIVPPGEEATDIDFGDSEAAVAALMAAYIRDTGLFRKVMDRALESEKLRPILMDVTAVLHVFAVPAEAKEITDAVPVSEPEEMDVRKQAQDGEGMGETYPEGKEAPGEEG